MIVYIVTACLVAIVVTKLTIKLHTGMCKSTRKLHGKTAIVTGANTGIGKATAHDLARRGARVILACRDRQRGQEARDDIIKTTKNENVVLEIVDLCSLSSVRNFVQRVKESEHHLDILVNNAGAIFVDHEYTADNLPVSMQGNHYGPFLLTLLLLDLLKKSAPSRIVVVASMSHKHASFNLENINDRFPKYTAYSNSKLCNVLFANELARKLTGTGVTVNSLTTGLVASDVFRNLPRFVLPVVKCFLKLVAKTNEEGAQTSIYLAVSEEVEGISGKYFEDCKEAATSSKAKDEEFARKLWIKSEQLVNLKPEERFW